MLLIKNGRVLDPASRTDAALDVLLDGERIVQVGASIAASDAEVLDAKGLIVAPGLLIFTATCASRGRKCRKRLRQARARPPVEDLLRSAACQTRSR